MPTYFELGELLCENGNVRVFDFEHNLYLDIDKQLWMCSAEESEIILQIGDGPKGKCLEMGLGLGVASQYILSLPAVTSLTTIEINRNVIDIYRKFNTIDPRHIILNGSCIDYIITTDHKCNFIFLDFYLTIDEDTIEQIVGCIRLCKRILKDDGEIVAWIDIWADNNYINRIKEAVDEIYKDNRR